MRCFSWLFPCAAFLMAAGTVGSPAESVEPSEQCGRCHQSIYETWKASSHARSMDDAFLQAFRELQEEGNRQQVAICLDCHAPLATLTGDRDLEYKLSWEGVSCEACHLLVSVDLSGKGPRRVLEPGAVKRAPLGGDAGSAHEVARSELHSTSRACAWCHEYVQADGTPVLSTFSEWQASGAAERGETCQSCHMDLARAEVADPRVERLAGAKINLHRVPGGHSLEQLNKALGATIRSERAAEELAIELELHNKGAGHAVPTGMPGRRVLLDLLVSSSDGRQFEAHKTYGRFFVDADGAEITRDSDYFRPGVKLKSDSRFRPDERRAERFRFPIGRGETAYVTLKLHYEHAPLGGEEGRTRLTFLSEKRTLVAEGRENP